jgi:DNA-binding ferritin-like protein
MALTNTDVKEIEKIARKEMKDFLETTQAHTIVMKIIQKEIGARSVDERIVDLSSKVVVELFKTLWQRKSFWEQPLKSVR